jgi:SAM-dependent methyltransferase
MTNGADRIDGPVTMPSDVTGWWERERATFIRERVLARTEPGEFVVDVGCGRGTMFEGEIDTSRSVVRVDSHLWAEWLERPGMYVCAAADALPFRNGAFDLVGSFDVLEHLDHDRSALGEQVRITRRGGVVVAAVPADTRLWSQHDEAVGHRRRYDAAGLRLLAQRCGLHVDATTHFFSFLWLPAWLTRRSALRSSEPGTGSSVLSRIVQWAIAVVCLAERSLARRVSLPFGTSIWIESVAPDDGRVSVVEPR